MTTPEVVLLGPYLSEWLERRSTQLRPTTIAGYRRVIDNHLRVQLGHRPLSELSRREIERAYADLLTSGGPNGTPLSPRTVQQFHAVLHRALEDAQLDGLITQNPAAEARAPKQDLRVTAADDDLQVWTSDQVAEFLRQVDDHPHRALWHVAIGTGARRGELLGLRWRDVDLDAATVTIQRALSVVDGVPRLLQPKSGRRRRMSIGTSVVGALERHHSEQESDRLDAGEDWQDRWDLVFTEPTGRYIHPSTLTTRFCRLVRKLDVPTIRLHDLRHTHASLLLELGVPIKVISERLGHSTISMTMDTYAHLMPAMDQEAAATFDEVIRSARPDQPS